VRGTSGRGDGAEPTVSVIIATNRAAEFLGDALDSVARQSRPPSEVLVVDDGSREPESIRAVVERYPDVRLVRREHAGVSAARNAGVRATTGTWIAFLDDDDRWHPDRLDLQAESIRSRPDAVLAYCGMRSIDTAGRETAPADQVEVVDRLDVARRRTGIFMGNALVRRDAYLGVGGLDEGLRLAEDLDLVLRLAELGPFTYAPGALVDYRTHGENVTGSHHELFRSVALVLARHLADARAQGDAELAAALRESRRANSRFAWWSALRAARARLSESRPFAAFAEVAWAVRAAPAAPADAILRRVARPGRRVLPGSPFFTRRDEGETSPTDPPSPDSPG
jgi:glycosyltransferase involved in cell wall biosynthesis